MFLALINYTYKKDLEKLMEIYPTITTNVVDTPIIAFDKLDGSNIRAEWSRKSSFSKFGTRKRLLDANEKPFGEAIGLFMDSYADNLDAIFRKQRYERATAFVEFAGERSFAGFHEDEPHKVTLFDVHVYKQGMLPAKEFLKVFGNKVETAEVLFEGKVTQEFKDSVRNSTLEGMTFEGVVCKGGLDNRRRPINFKLKSQVWFDKLRNKVGDNDALFEKLK